VSKSWTMFAMFYLGLVVATSAMLFDEWRWGRAENMCFVNHTCRDSMRCVTGVGMEDGVCVK